MYFLWEMVWTRCVKFCATGEWWMGGCGGHWTATFTLTDEQQQHQQQQQHHKQQQHEREGHSPTAKSGKAKEITTGEWWMGGCGGHWTATYLWRIIIIWQKLTRSSALSTTLARYLVQGVLKKRNTFTLTDHHQETTDYSTKSDWLIRYYPFGQILIPECWKATLWFHHSFLWTTLL